jgi:hypothetical protein
VATQELALPVHSVSGILDGIAIGDGTGWRFAVTLRFREDSGMPMTMLIVQPDEEPPYWNSMSKRVADWESHGDRYERQSGHTSLIAETLREWLLRELRFRSR